MTTYKQANPYAQPRCEICRFCLAPGRCHRFPPQAVATVDPRAEETVLYVFPKVWYSDWCGEFKLDADTLRSIEADAKKRKQP